MLVVRVVRVVCVCSVVGGQSVRASMCYRFDLHVYVRKQTCDECPHMPYCALSEKENPDCDAAKTACACDALNNQCGWSVTQNLCTVASSTTCDECPTMDRSPSPP